MRKGMNIDAGNALVDRIKPAANAQTEALWRALVDLGL